VGFDKNGLRILPVILNMEPSLWFQSIPDQTKWSPDDARLLARFLLDWARDVEHKRISIDPSQEMPKASVNEDDDQDTHCFPGIY